MYAMLHALAHTKGDMIFWSDTSILCRGSCKRHYLKKAYDCVNSDLWNKLGLALKMRGEGEITVKHMRATSSSARRPC